MMQGKQKVSLWLAQSLNDAIDLSTEQESACDNHVPETVL